MGERRMEVGSRKGIVDGNSHPHGEVTEEILVHMLQRAYNNKVFSGTGSSGAFVTNVSYQNGEPSEWARCMEMGIRKRNYRWEFTSTWKSNRGNFSTHTTTMYK